MLYIKGQECSTFENNPRDSKNIRRISGIHHSKTRHERWYDEEAVHTIGEVPIFAKLLVGPLGRFLQETFQ